MKKGLAAALICSMMVSLAACGGSTGNAGSTAAAETKAETKEETKAEAKAEGTGEEAAASEGDSYVLKFALQNGENHPLCQGVAKFGEILEEKSGGRIKMELFYGCLLYTSG